MSLSVRQVHHGRITHFDAGSCAGELLAKVGWQRTCDLELIAGDIELQPVTRDFIQSLDRDSLALVDVPSLQLDQASLAFEDLFGDLGAGRNFLAQQFQLLLGPFQRKGRKRRDVVRGAVGGFDARHQSQSIRARLDVLDAVDFRLRWSFFARGRRQLIAG